MNGENSEKERSEKKTFINFLRLFPPLVLLLMRTDKTEKKNINSVTRID